MANKIQLLIENSIDDNCNFIIQLKNILNPVNHTTGEYIQEDDLIKNKPITFKIKTEPIQLKTDPIYPYTEWMMGKKLLKEEHQSPGEYFEEENPIKKELVTESVPLKTKPIVPVTELKTENKPKFSIGDSDSFACDLCEYQTTHIQCVKSNISNIKYASFVGA